MTREEIMQLNTDYLNNCESEQEMNELFYYVLELQKQMQEPRWIPVSERLPEDGTYLICTDDGYISTIMYDRSMGWLLDANIIAWMPLPQPYKAESEGKE